MKFERFLYDGESIDTCKNLNFRALFSHRFVKCFLVRITMYRYFTEQTQREVTFKDEKKTVNVSFGIDVP